MWVNIKGNIFSFNLLKIYITGYDKDLKHFIVRFITYVGIIYMIIIA